jgi:hypothetical protein
VKVSSDSVHYTFTAVDGSFTLNTAGSSEIQSSPSGQKPRIQWHPEQGFISWAGYSGKASMEVRNAQGALVAKSFPDQCCSDSRFSLSGLPQGMYVATLRTPGQPAIQKTIGLRKVAAPLATDTLTFVKAGYTQITRIVTGSQSNLAVQMQPASKIRYVFVIAMENTDAFNTSSGTYIYGNTANAPYINDSLMTKYAHASNFGDELPINIISEPHYVWMEAGTNAFADHTFSDDSDPSATISTNSTAHLATQIKNAGNGTNWMSYQEGINTTTGTCPIVSSAFYAPKHDPFVFFQDVAGNPPSKTNAYCTAHHKPITSLAADLTNHAVASYNFITPNLCNDMHGAGGCPNSNIIRSGDDWLRTNLPPLIAFANANAGVIFITWDEGVSTRLMAFFVIGPNVKRGYVSTLAYDHSSMLKSMERILQLPILPTVTTANDFADFFTAGNYP